MEYTLYENEVANTHTSTRNVNHLPTTAIDKHVGSRLRVRRLSLGISQQELARRLSLTFQQIQKYEKGANRVGASRLYELASTLGVDVTFFFQGLDPITGGSLDQSEVVEAFREASPRFGAREFVELNRAFLNIKDPRIREVLLTLVGLLSEIEVSAAGNQAAPDAPPDAKPSDSKPSGAKPDHAEPEPGETDTVHDGGA